MKKLPDVEGDGIVNILDLVVVANAFGEEEPDLNGDSVVNIEDLVIVANAFKPDRKGNYETYMYSYYRFLDAHCNCICPRRSLDAGCEPARRCSRKNSGYLMKCR